jgi:hypothetical protein
MMESLTCRAGSLNSTRRLLEVYMPAGRLILQQKCPVRGRLQYREGDLAIFSKKDTYF